MENNKTFEDRFDEKIKQWKEEAIKIPENTCPFIDDVLKEVNYINESNNDLSDVEFALSKAREMNIELRELGEYWYKKTKELKEFFISENKKLLNNK